MTTSSPTEDSDGPARRPGRPFFSSGPCAKRPGWRPEALAGALVGRSHRSAAGKTRIAEAIARTRRILGVPPDYRVGIVPGSDTGAFEMAMWSLLGAHGVDALAWESFGQGWVTDLREHLRLGDLRVFAADYGELPDLSRVDAGRDVVFTWNGTTSGVRVPDGAWIGAGRGGLTLCDATSAVFAQRLPWRKLDAATFSWQKALGGEAAHGMLVLGPRAVERLESHTPPWPLPKVFRLTKGGKLAEDVFQGSTINTPSLLCVEDWLDALTWADGIGGLAALLARADANLAVVAEWVAATPWVDFLARVPATRSNTSVCLKIVDGAFAALGAERQAAVPKRMASLLEQRGVAYDVAGYRDAPPGLRVWCGATVERADVEALLPWLDWAYARAMEASC
jgi:phosphoserine aminotransferase